MSDKPTERTFQKFRPPPLKITPKIKVTNLLTTPTNYDNITLVEIY